MQTHFYSTSPSCTKNDDTSPLSSTTIPSLSEDASAYPSQQISSTPFQPPTRITTRSQHNIFKPKNSTDYSVLVVSNDTTVVPQTYKKAVQHAPWCYAMFEKIVALVKNNT